MERRVSAGRRWYLTLLGSLAAVCIAAAAVWFALGQPGLDRRAEPAWLLKDNGGRLALYNADGSGPLAQYDIYTRLLPEPDVLALQGGVAVQDAADLQQKLEDYGL